MSAPQARTGARRPPPRQRSKAPIIAVVILAVLAFLASSLIGGVIVLGGLLGSAGGVAVGADAENAANINAATCYSPITVDGEFQIGALSKAQTRNAQLIVAAGLQRDAPKQEIVIALMTAMVESELLNVASSGNGQEASQSFPNDGVRPPNAQSVGLFQQQPWWGPMNVRMDPVGSAGLFYTALEKVNGWESMPLGDVAQRVQASAYPDRYALRERDASTLYDGLYQKVSSQLGASTPTATATSTATPTSTDTATVTNAALTDAGCGPGVYNGSLDGILAGEWADPLHEPYTITSGFPYYNSGGAHTGADLATHIGTPVYAAADGTVIAVQHLTYSFGNHIRIAHGGNVISIYGHLSVTYVQPGQKVKKGDLIGESGSSGRSSGPHLHFEVRTGATGPFTGVPVDPFAWMKLHGTNLACPPLAASITANLTAAQAC